MQQKHAHYYTCVSMSTLYLKLAQEGEFNKSNHTENEIGMIANSLFSFPTGAWADCWSLRNGERLALNRLHGGAKKVVVAFEQHFFLYVRRQFLPLIPTAVTDIAGSSVAHKKKQAGWHVSCIVSLHFNGAVLET